MSKINALCVYCGSNPGTDAAFVKAAHDFGKILGENGIRLIYGGGSIGLMGALAASVIEHGGEVTGIIPEFLTAAERPRRLAQELIVTRDMHERKRTMFERADAFVALPGGLGTLEELAEVLTWSQLGLQSKPCGLLDVEGFFDPLLAFLDHTVAERFVSVEHRALVLAADRPDVLLDRLAGWRGAPADFTWVDR